jgi:hypothetical protein
MRLTRVWFPSFSQPQSGLTHVQLPMLRNIGRSAYAEWTALVEIELPEFVTIMV